MIKMHKIYLVFLSTLITLLLTHCKFNKTEFNSSENLKKPTTVIEKIKPYKDYYPSGNLKSEGQFIDELKTGKWTSYYDNGELQSIANYKKGILDGYQKTDYSQVLYMEGSLKNGIKIGVWKSYFKKTNAIKYLKQFDENGKATGEWKNYYDSGELVSIENYLNNKANGKQIEYFKNGNISSIGQKRNGQNDGIWKYYYDDGPLLCKKEFKNGVDNGKYIQYFKNGKVHKIGIKQNFKKVGTWKIYNNQGDLIEIVSYDN